MQVLGRGAGSRQGPPRPAEDRLLTAPHQPQRQSLLLKRTRVPSRPHLLKPQSLPEGHPADTTTVGVGASARRLGDTRLPSTARVPAVPGPQLSRTSQAGTPNRQGAAPTGTCCLQPAHGSRPPCRAPGSCPSDSSEGQAGPAQHSRRDGGTRCSRAPSGHPPHLPAQQGLAALVPVLRAAGAALLGRPLAPQNLGRGVRIPAGELSLLEHPARL